MLRLLADCLFRQQTYKYQDVPAMINNSPELLTFNSKDGYIKQKLVVRIWIEGTDREAHFAFNGGNLIYKLNFVGIEKDPALTLAEGAIVYNNGNLVNADLSELTNGEYVYSLNGIDWQTYSKGNSLINDSHIVYVKRAETQNRKASNYIAVSIPQPETPEEGN